MACLDTTVLLDLLSDRRKARRRRAADLLRRLSSAGEELVTTRFNIAELWVGVFRSHAPRHERAHIAGVERMFRVLEFGEAAAQVFGAVTARLQRLRRPAGDMDGLIASVALANGHSLVTRNPKHFVDIEDLVVVCY